MINPFQVDLPELILWWVVMGGAIGGFCLLAAIELLGLAG